MAICEKHGIEYEVVAKPMFGKVFNFGGCPECDKEFEAIEQEKAFNEKKSYDEIVLERFHKRCNIEPEYYGATLENFIANTQSLEHAKQVITTLIETKTGKVIMLGKNGTGKTHLACAAVKALKGKILTMYEISTGIRSTYKEKSEIEEIDYVDELANLPLLAIDELGRTKGSDAETNWLSYIIDKRHTRKLPLIIISNKHVRKLCEKGGCENCLENYISEDIMSRLSDGGTRLQFDGEDNRRTHFAEKKAVRE